MLTAIILLPVVGALLLAVLPPDRRLIRAVSVTFTLLPLLLGIYLLANFNPTQAGPQFVERVPWVRVLNFNVDYYLGVDGLSLPLLLLNLLLGFLAVLVSWNISHRDREYFILLLILVASVSGVFSALDYFLFFLFWEVEVIPMYLLIGVWGTGRREYSAVKYLVYTLVGSAAMLFGILWLYFTAGIGTFDMLELGRLHLAREFQALVFLALIFGFAVKLPVFPFHTWLPDAHTDAPTAVSVLLAGILLKMGGYGIIRGVVNIAPEAAQMYAPLLVALAVVNVVYGALVCLNQLDLKRLVAFSSISHMGYVLMGIAAGTQVALTGAVLQMVSHGLITGMLFSLVGLVYDKAHTRQIPDLGGLAARMPIIGWLFVFAGLAALGLPGLSGFIAEFLVFLGTFPVWPLPAILGVVSVVITAGYILWAVERVFFGPVKRVALEQVGDADFVEWLPLAVFAAMIALIGVYPRWVTDIINVTLPQLVARLGG